MLSQEWYESHISTRPGDAVNEQNFNGKAASHNITNCQLTKTCASRTFTSCTLFRARSLLSPMLSLAARKVDKPLAGVLNKNAGICLRMLGADPPTSTVRVRRRKA